MESPRRGLPCGWGGGKGAGRVFAGNWGGEGLNIFFSGPKCLEREEL